MNITNSTMHSQGDKLSFYVMIINNYFVLGCCGGVSLSCLFRHDKKI